MLLLLLLLMMLVMRLLRGSVEGGREEEFVVLGRRGEGTEGNGSCGFREEVPGKWDRRQRKGRSRSRELKRRVTGTGR